MKFSAVFYRKKKFVQKTTDDSLDSDLAKKKILKINTYY